MKFWSKSDTLLYLTLRTPLLLPPPAVLLAQGEKTEAESMTDEVMLTGRATVLYGTVLPTISGMQLLLH